MGEKMKKIILCLIVFLQLIIPAHAESTSLAANAGSMILLDASSRKILNSKNETEKMYPASTTKIMTMILMFEAINSGKISFDDMVTASNYAASMGGTQVYLEPNETMSLMELFKCMAIGSANDATVAIGEYIAGTNDEFIKMMNAKAKELKLANTNFTNATGLHDENHYSCAYDLGMMAAYLIEIGGDQLLSVTSTYDTYIRENTAEKFWLVNTNKLLNGYPGVDGLKTGYTKESGYCIVTTAVKDNFRVIGVVMDEPDPKTRNNEMYEMLDYAFNMFEKKLIYPKGEIVNEIPILNSEIKTASLYAKEDISYLMKKTDDNEADYDIEIIHQTAPIQKDEVVARMNIRLGDDIIESFDLIVNEDINALTFFQRMIMDIQYLFQ